MFTGFPASAGEPVARAGSITIEAEAVRAALARGGRDIYEPAAARPALEEVISFELLAAEAKRLGYDQQPDVQDQIKRMIVQRLVADKVDRQISRQEITEADLKQYYDTHAEEFRSAAMVRGQILSVLVRDMPEAARKKADEICAAAKDEDFAALVRRHSDFANERLNGGDTGWLVDGSHGKRYPEEIVKALLALDKPGEVTPPVVTPQVIYIGRLNEKRPSKISPFEEVRPGLPDRLLRDQRQKLYDAFLAQLRQSVKVEVNEAALKSLAETLRQGSTPPPAPFRAQ